MSLIVDTAGRYTADIPMLNYAAVNLALWSSTFRLTSLFAVSF